MKWGQYIYLVGEGRGSSHLGTAPRRLQPQPPPSPLPLSHQPVILTVHRPSQHLCVPLPSLANKRELDLGLALLG